MAAPSLDVVVSSNAPELRRVFREMARTQIPFATAVALTKLAQLGRDAGRTRLEAEFKVRSKRVPRGLSIERAEKRDWPNPKAIVGHRDEFMLLHETGGFKKPQKGARRIAIPTRVVKRTTTGRIVKRHKPASLGSKLEERPGRFGAKRLELTSRRARKDRRRILFLLRRRVRIEPRFRLRATVNGVAAAQYGPIFTRALDAAMRSARVRAGKFTSAEGKTFFNRAAAKAGL